MPPRRRSPDSAFLMTPEQYQARAAYLRSVGNDELAGQYENLYLLRMKRAPEWLPGSPSIVPE
jgi:hypothetical protein